MKKLKLFKILIILVFFRLAHAETTTIDVSTTVTATCTVSISSDLIFPSFSPTKINTELQSNIITITPVCTKGTPYSISSNSGIYQTTREMPHKFMYNRTTQSLLSYYLRYNNATVVSDTIMINAVGNGFGGESQAFTLYGFLFTANNNITPGSYNDTITFTLTY